MLLFVYGSLKKGFSNHHLLKKAEFKKQCKTGEKFALINLGYYPALIEKPCYQVEGELYEIRDDDEETLKAIDKLEQYPDFYDKKVIRLDSEEFAFVYYIKENVINKHIKKHVVMNEGTWKSGDRNGGNSGFMETLFS